MIESVLFTQRKDDKGIMVESTLNDFIFKHPKNKWFVRIGVVAIILQFIAFKLLYPFASFINGDSYVYLETAYHNLIVNTYPVGYSKFLRLFSVFTHSDTALVLFQFLFLHASTLALLFTIFYFYEPLRLTRVLLFVVMIANPVYLYLANYISSDAFFLSLSLIWFTLLIWIMNKPTDKLILINAIILFLAFTVRYNALFYPIVGCAALLLSRRKILMNIMAFALSLLLIGFFIQVARIKYKEISGKSQFTPFTGWQIANNALYAYRYIDSAQRKDVPIALRPLDKMVRHYFDTSRDVRTHPIESMMASTVYMWDPRSPLSIYMNSQFKNDTTASELKKWAVVAPVMRSYGDFLIKSYPKEFARFYLIPNAIKYYVPPVEFLGQYSTGVDSVHFIAKAWFDYRSNKITCHFKDFNVRVLNYYPIMVGTLNVVLVLSIISFIILKGYRYDSRLARGMTLVSILWAVNFGFSVFASPIALRFQLFPIIVSMVFAFLMVEFLIKAARGTVGEPEYNAGPTNSEAYCVMQKKVI